MRRLQEFGGILSSNKMTVSPSINHKAQTFQQQAQTTPKKTPEKFAKTAGRPSPARKQKLLNESSTPQIPRSRMTATMPSMQHLPYARQAVDLYENMYDSSKKIPTKPTPKRAATKGGQATRNQKGGKKVFKPFVSKSLKQFLAVCKKLVE